MTGERRPWLIDGRGLRGYSAVRGIGTYVRELLIAWQHLGVSDRFVLLGDRGHTTAGAPGPFGTRQGPGIPRLKRRIQPVCDPFMVSVALRRVRPALYHAVEWAQPLVTGGVPVVLTIHDLIPFVFPEAYRWIRRERLLALRQARQASAVVVPSRATARDVESLGDVDPARIHVVPYGVAADCTPAGEAAVAAAMERYGLAGRPYLIAVGSFDARKRPDDLAAIVAQVRRHHDVRLCITGDQGMFLPAVEAALQRHGVAASTVLAGFVERDELSALYTGAGALLFTSAYEGFGLPLLEAMACGTRTVCFDNSSLVEVAGDVGAVVPDGDLPAMAAAVCGVLAEPAGRRAEMVARGRAWAARFPWERAAGEYLDLYARLERLR